MSSSPGRLAMPRRRGAASGLLILICGAIGVLMPILGKSLGLDLGSEGRFDTDRLLLQYLPGVVAVVGGLELMRTANRATGVLGAQLGIAAGAWFVVGRTVSRLWNEGQPVIGTATGGTAAATAAELLAFSGIGGLLLLFGGIAFARVSARLEGDTERLTTAAATRESQTSSERERAKEHQREQEAAAARERDSGTSIREPGTTKTRVEEPGTGATRVQDDPPPPDPGTRA